MGLGNTNVSGVSAPDFKAHADDKTNPHAVTKAQVGLGNVDNTSDADKPISNATQTALNGKANSSHGTHVSFSSTAPKMDGTAAAGSASTVARSDHVHPTDTSRLSTTGTAAAATKLATARTIKINLGADSAASFDGTANVTPGVTGVLSTLHGGTGNNTGRIHAGEISTEPMGGYATAEGFNVIARGAYSHAEGHLTTANHDSAHAEGDNTFATSETAHTEGFATIATAYANELAHASVDSTKKILTIIDDDPINNLSKIASTLSDSFINTTVYAMQTSAVSAYRQKRTITAVDVNAKTITLNSALALSNATYLIFDYRYTSTNAKSSAHAEGFATLAAYEDAHAEGVSTIAAARGQHAQGCYNKASISSTDKFIIGKGTSESARANCFRVTDTGVYASGNYNASGADYAELFEWKDGNPDNVDRVGLFVTLDGEKIRLANPDDDFILGVISGNPSVVGDVEDDQWRGMYLYDIYSRPLWEDVEVPDEYDERETVDENGETVTEKILIREAHIEHRQKLNPDYDSSQPYQKRTERKEWGCVGMMGKLVVNDDGSCAVNGWAKPGEGGTATKSETPTKYRVMSRIDDAHIRILIL